MRETAELEAAVSRVLARWPAAGLAVAVVRGDQVWFHGRGAADLASGVPVDEDAVFRIASITKTFTAIAVVQLWERSLVDLDAPAAEYLRAFRLVPARPGFRPATVRHLLTHTAGVRALRGPADLFRPAMGWGSPAAVAVPPLQEYYRRGLHVDAEPGTRWAYSNHGFTALGQIVADVTGVPLARYLREHVFAPLGMETTDVDRSERVRAHLATGYEVRPDGLRPVADLEVITAGGGAAYSTARDMARYVAALLGGGANEHGSVLRPASMEAMFAPQYRPDPRVPGMGLGFQRGRLGGYITVGHDGIWKGFLSDLVAVPEAGVGVVALVNTGNFEPRGAPTPTTRALLGLLLDDPSEEARGPVPQRPWTWREVCGWYAFGPGVLTDPQPRMLLGAGVEVAVKGGRLVLRGQMPVPAVRRGLPLDPDGADPDVFRIDLSPLGAGPSRVVFSRDHDGHVAALHLTLVPMTFVKRPDATNPRPWVDGALAVGAAATLVGRVARGRRLRTMPRSTRGSR